MWNINFLIKSNISSTYESYKIQDPNYKTYTYVSQINAILLVNVHDHSYEHCCLHDTVYTGWYCQILYLTM